MAGRKGKNKSNCEKWEEFIEPLKKAKRRSSRFKEENGDEESTTLRDADKKRSNKRDEQKIGDVECLSKTVSLGIADSRRESEGRRKGTDSSGATGQIDTLTKSLSQLELEGKSGASASADASSDVHCSLSQCTFDLVTKYIPFIDDDHFLELDGGNRFPKKIKKELQGITNKIRETMKGRNSTLGIKTIGDPVENEAEARILIDCVVMELGNWLNVKIKPEFSLYYKNLRGGRLDYFFIDRKGKPLGCLEAKNHITCDEDAFTQTVMELLLVQQEAIGMGLPATTPLFGILSDGKRYILIMLEGHYLMVERSRGKLKVRNVEKINDFNNLIAAIVRMILRCQNSTGR